MIIGTAGHIDHGKTAIVRQLTGIDTDRLPEEKKRGMTIDLGFANMGLSGIGEVGIVDVPGHERFIRNMVAGATGIDVVLLVVAADDGVMPQTQEHLDIVNLLGITRGVVALNKTDLVSAERAVAVTGDIHELLDSTPLKDAPVIPVSAATGEGLATLREELATGLAAARARSDAGPFWMAMDRVFVARGFGIVGTGTIASGRVTGDAQLRLLPGGRMVRVRGIQTHSQSVECATPGNRCALNLSGVDKQSLHRGMVICEPGLKRVATTVDGQVTLVGDLDRPVKSHSRIRLHAGTAETIARLQWLEAEAPKPGGTGLAQFRLEEAMPLLYGHRFVMRDVTAQRTLGGGVVLDPFAARRGARLPERVDRLYRLSALDPDESLAVWLERRGADGWLLPDLAEQLGETPESLAQRLAGAPDVWREDVEGTLWVGLRHAVDALGPKLVAAVSDYLSTNPRTTAMGLATLRSTVCPRLDLRIFRSLLERLVAAGELESAPEGVRSVGHRQIFSPEDEALAERIAELLAYQDKPPPKLDALARILRQSVPRVRRFLGELERAGRVVQLATGIYVDNRELEAWRNLVHAYLAEHSQITVAQFRDEARIGRGFAITVLEYLDREGVTKRTGDVRVVATASQQGQKSNE